MRVALSLVLVWGCGPDLDALRGDEVRLLPPSDAGAIAVEPDAGAIEVIEPIAPAPECGLPGLACCEGSVCEVGACLRGGCAAASGAVAEADGCSDPCGARNPFTAGCSCAQGFARSDVGALTGQCHGGEPTNLSVGFCDGGLGSAFVELSPACGGCASPHPLTGRCACPAGQRALRFDVGRTTVACGDAPAALGVCVVPAGRGAFQRDPLVGCRAPNPETGGCACPEGSVEQTLRLTRPEGDVRVPAPVTLCLDP